MRTVFIFVFLLLIASITSYPKYRSNTDANIPDVEEIGNKTYTKEF